MKFCLTFEEFISENQDWKEALKKVQKKIESTEDSLLKNAQRIKSQYGTKEVQDRFDMKKLFGQFLSKEKKNALNITDYNLKYGDDILKISIFLNDSKIPNILVDFNVNTKRDEPRLLKYKNHEVFFYNELPKFKVDMGTKAKMSKEYITEVMEIMMDFIMDFYAWWEIADYTRPKYFSGGNHQITKKQMRGTPISWDDFKKYY